MQVPLSRNHVTRFSCKADISPDIGLNPRDYTFHFILADSALGFQKAGPQNKAPGALESFLFGVLTPLILQD